MLISLVAFSSCLASRTVSRLKYGRGGRIAGAYPHVYIYIQMLSLKLYGSNYIVREITEIEKKIQNQIQK